MYLDSYSKLIKLDFDNKCNHYICHLQPGGTVPPPPPQAGPNCEDCTYDTSGLGYLPGPWCNTFYQVTIGTNRCILHMATIYTKLFRRVS